MHRALATPADPDIQSDAWRGIGVLLESRRYCYPPRMLIAFAEESARQLKAWAAEERAKLGLPDVD